MSPNQTIRVISDQKGLGWKIVRKGSATLLFAGSILGKDSAEIITQMKGLNSDVSEIRGFCGELRGHFGLIFQDAAKIIITSDCVSSFPIFYRVYGNVCKFATCIKPLVDECKIDESQARALMLSGYTIGTKTLFREVFTLHHGQIFFQFKNHNLFKTRHYQFTPWRKTPKPCLDQLKRKLVDVTIQSMERVVEQASNRMIAVPLSAGLDSRLIASCLKEIGATNVICYSYGPRDNFESKVARQISARLGFEWAFVELTPSIQREFWATKIPENFAGQSNDGLSAPVYHDLLVTHALLERQKITPDTVVVNGNSGDFITGNHIPLSSESAKVARSQEDVNLLLDAMLKKHYSMWEELRTTENLDAIRSLLLHELNSIKSVDGKKSIADLHEYLEMTNRQIKWVIKRQKIYDFLSLSWALPLWDRDFMSFWESVPVQHKQNQSLYKEVLREQNWGGVWDGIPGNSERFVSPKWMRYAVRPFFKVLLSPLGKLYWHRFEKRFLDYWLDELGLYGPFGYFAILNEKGIARNCLAPHIRAYVREMGFVEKS